MLSSILAFVVFAAEEAHHGESDKTLFYVVGGLTALYAVVIATLGIRKHDFPATKGAARGVFAASALFVVATMVSSIVTG